MSWFPELQIAGGFLCGALAGGAARFGRLCSMSAIEDALIGRDWRAAKAWGLAIATAIAATQALVFFGVADLTGALYAAPSWHALGTLVGGLLFGLGMALAGTCSFGLLVRAGGGDLRSAVSAGIVGIAAFAVTSGLLAPFRETLLGFGKVNLEGRAGCGIGHDQRVRGWEERDHRRLDVDRGCLGGAGWRRPAAADPPTPPGWSRADGLSVAAGWGVTSAAVERLQLDRPESLSFVAPVGRALLQFMMQPFRNLGFGVSSIAGVIVASFAVAAWRRELRWEAFDDPTEMRRHIFGACLMGIGGVLAQGCTIGQGLSAASALAISAPVFLVAVLIGARMGLSHLIEGQALWRLGLGKPRRPESLRARPPITGAYPRLTVA